MTSKTANYNINVTSLLSDIDISSRSVVYVLWAFHGQGVALFLKVALASPFHHMLVSFMIHTTHCGQGVALFLNLVVASPFHPMCPL